MEYSLLNKETTQLLSAPIYIKKVQHLKNKHNKRCATKKKIITGTERAPLRTFH